MTAPLGDGGTARPEPEDAGAEPSPDAGRPERHCRRASLDLVAIAGQRGPLGPRALLTRDVSRDGRPDLVLLLKELERLVVLEQRPDAGFEPQPLLEAGSTPNDVEAADLDGDGRDELLVVGHFSDALRVSRGLERGWAQPTVYPLGNHCQRLELIDLNGDGRLDVVTKNGGSAGFFTFTFLLGQRDGSFAPAVASRVGDTPVDLVIRPRGSTGTPEVLIATANTAQLERWAWDGDGGFSPRTAIALPARPLRVSRSARDETLFATHGFESPGFISLLTPSDGGFSLHSRLEVDEPFEALPVDLSGDEVAELVVTTLSGRVRVFDGLPDGGFGEGKVLADGGWPTSLVAQDLDGDQRVDLAWTTADGALELVFDADRCRSN